ncbi:hypothetical protein GBA52_007502 [Prunus armeniaca]|nr:hypothetical protein GBA52_007502 [Prunus armeniaca]
MAMKSKCLLHTQNRQSSLPQKIQLKTHLPSVLFLMQIQEPTKSSKAKAKS